MRIEKELNAQPAPDAAPSKKRFSFKNNLYLQSTAVFGISLLVLGLVAQLPFTYRLNIGTTEANWQIGRGFGDPEKNENFAFRWTIDKEAEVRLPDVGWPSRVGLVGVAPRPTNSAPLASLQIGQAVTSFSFSPAQASQPPDEAGRLTFEAAGPSPNFNLTFNALLIGSDLYQPPNDPRSLGLVVSQVYIKPQPTRLGLIVPPLTQWFGWTLLLTLVYLRFQIYTLSGAGDLRLKKANQDSGSGEISSRLRFGQGSLLPLVGAGGALALVVGAQLLFRSWLAFNGAGVAWGAALILIGWLVGERFGKTGPVLIGLLLASVLLLYYQLVMTAFIVSAFAGAGAILLGLVWQHRFERDSENIGLLISGAGGVGWGLWQWQIPRTYDISRYHLYWLNELDRLIRLGNFYPRWAVDFSWQKGSPVFNFYPPLSRYLAESFHLLGLNFNSALMLTEFGATLLGAVGCYVWTTTLTGERRAALLAGLAFCYYPYKIAEIYAIGTLANLLAGALLPWLFWLLTRLIRQPDQPFVPLWLGIAGGAFAICNNPQLILFIPVGLLYLAGLALLEWRKGKLDWGRAGAGLLIAGLIAFGLSAFFLLPAAFESNQVSLNEATADLNETSKFYARWPENLALWQPIWPLMQNQDTLFGTLHYLLALAGLGVWLLRRQVARPYLILIFGVLAFTFLIQWPFSSFFWKAFPPLKTVQFTSRLMNAGAVLSAPLIGGLVSTGKTKISRRITVPVAVIALGLMLYACFHDLTYSYWPNTFNGFISQKSLTEQLINGDQMYMPKGIVDTGRVSRYDPPIFEDGRAIGIADKLDWKLTGADSYELRAVLSREGSVTLPLFWYEGWWKVSDQPGQLYPNQPTPRFRLVNFNLPAGEHFITVKLQDSPVKTAGNIISIISVFGVGLYLFFLLRRKKRP